MQCASSTFQEKTMRQNNYILSIVSAVLLIGTGAIAPVFAMPQETSVSFQRDIVVTGTGQVSVKPDTVFISLGVTTNGKEAALIGRQNASKTAAVIKAIKSTGIPDADIRTEEYRLEADYADRNDTRVFKGYVVNNVVQVTVRTTAKAERVLDLALKAGANTVGSVSFGIANSQKAQNEALSKAIVDATRQAKLAAKVAGINQIRLVQLQSGGENSGEFRMPGYASNNLSNVTSLRGGRQTVTVTVTAHFEIVEMAPILTP